jgi:DNA-binding NarL/FixJ family response regulator
MTSTGSRFSTASFFAWDKDTINDNPPSQPLTISSVLLVDDHPMTRGGLRVTLQAVPGIRTFFEARTGRDALEIFGASSVDLIVIDLCLPDMDGLDLVRKVRASAPALPIVVVSMHDEKSLIDSVFREG